MSHNRDNTELFVRYLNRKLNLEEARAFELRLKLDIDFAKEFEEYKGIDFANIEEELMAFKRELEWAKSEKDSAWINKAPMMIERDDPEDKQDVEDVEDPDSTDDIDQAILERDIMALRLELRKINEEIDSEEIDPPAPIYAGVDKAVIERDTARLHDELELFSELKGYDKNSEEYKMATLEREIDFAIAEQNVIDFRSKIHTLGEELHPDKQRVLIPRKIIRVVSAAAIVLVLVSSGIIFGSGGKNFNNNRTLGQGLFDFAGPGDPRGYDDHATDFAIQCAYNAYQEGDFSTAANFYRIVEESGMGVPETWIYQGISLLKTDHISQAEEYFNKVLIDDDNCYSEVAEWYLVDCLLKRNKILEAQARLNKIVAIKGHDYHDKAQQLLRHIRRLQ